MFGPAVEADLLAVGVEFEAELGGDHHLAPKGRQRLAHQLFIGERAIDLRRVEEGDAALDRRPENPDPLAPVDRRAVAVAQTHRAVADRGDREPLFPSVRCFIVVSPSRATPRRSFVTDMQDRT